MADENLSLSSLLIRFRFCNSHQRPKLGRKRAMTESHSENPKARGEEEKEEEESFE